MKSKFFIFYSFVSMILSGFPKGTDTLNVSTSVQGQRVAGSDVVITCKYHPPSSKPGIHDNLRWFVNKTELVSCKYDEISTRQRCDPKIEDRSKYSFTADGLCCGSITIKRLTNDDENTYTCLVTTGAGIGTSRAILTIIHPIRLPDTLELIGTDNLQTNLSQKITCTSSHSYPAPTFRWYIDSRDVTADTVNLPPKIVGEGGRGDVVNATSVFTYRPSREDHGRNLVCSLTLSVSPSNLTVLNSSVVLEIHDPPLIFDPQVSTNWNGESCTASLSCSSYANPPANHFHWVKLGTEFVYNSSRTRHSVRTPGGLHDNERIGILLIEDVQVSDYGSYQCIVYDDDGERNLTSATLSLSRPSQSYRPNITAYPTRASSSSIFVAWQPNHYASIGGTCRVEYCRVNTSEEDCNTTTTSTSGANTTLTGLQSFTWYRLSLYCTNCAGTFSTQPLLASTAALSPNEYGIRLEYDLPNETLRLSISSYNLTIPDEICFKSIETLDATDCSRNMEKCVPAGSTLHKVVPLKSGFVGVVSYGRGTCSVPSFVRDEEDAKPSLAASRIFILMVTGATVGVAVVILALVFGVLMLARLCSHGSRKKSADHKETPSTYRSIDHVFDGMEENSGRTMDEDGLIYVAVSNEETGSTQQTSLIRTEEETIYSVVKTEGNGIRVDEDGLVYFSVSHPLQPDLTGSQENIQPEETTIYSNGCINSRVTETSSTEAHEDKTDVVDAPALPLYATCSKQKQV